MARKLTLETVAYHRNGICGEGFHVVNFHDSENGQMMAVVFPYRTRRDNCRVAVFNRDLLATSEIGFGLNSWRGDHYADWLKSVVVVHSESYMAPHLASLKTPGQAATWARKIGHAARLVLEGK